VFLSKSRSFSPVWNSYCSYTLENKEDVIRLGVNVLKRFIGDELGVILAEPHPEVGGGFKISYPRCGSSGCY
jgi:hypothetical protein